MDITTHPARITAPLSYTPRDGRKRFIPVGPCLVETMGGDAIDIIWGSRGQKSLTLQQDELEAAQVQGLLVVLD